MKNLVIQSIKKSKVKVFAACCFAFVSFSAVNAQDNLGNHTATQNLNMNQKIVKNATHVDLRAIQGAGIRFFSNEHYKIAFANNASYHYGPVSDYSIKVNMNNNPARGWTWGVRNETPVAAINTQGIMQIANDFYAMGKIGVGTNNPKGKLHVGDRLTINSNGGYSTICNNVYWNGSTATRYKADGSSLLMFRPDGDLTFSTTENAGAAEQDISSQLEQRFVIRRDGKVAIGDNSYVLFTESNGAQISADDYRLFVDKGILTEKVKVSLKNTNDWADYVFEEDYELNSIESVEEFVKENKHLPNVPSAKSVVVNGINVAEMDAKLLRQIEELWLHVIELKKENDVLKTRFDEQGK